jgi:5-(carboxyamino)imidazole ribonucleotide synthase
MNTAMLQPGDTIGILGGGQLGRMLALAASSLGLRTHIYAPERDSPAFDVTSQFTCASYDDEEALERFARSVNVATYEFENIPLKTAEYLARFVPLYPGIKALEVTQDRLIEKTTLAKLHLPVAPFHAVATREDLKQALQTLGTPAILKTRRFGYDGKGQVRITNPNELESAYALLQQGEAILEGVIPFTKEISVLIARGREGQCVAYDICENHHAHHILDETRVPARVSKQTAESALAMAQHIVQSLDYIGILAVEMFVVDQHDAKKWAPVFGNQSCESTNKEVFTQEHESLIINEMAPRVHNSGHWTLEGAITSQFSQHIRAIAGWPLGSTQRLGHVRMRNLIGADVESWHKVLSDPSACLHLYGKAEATKGRKMGHVTYVTLDHNTYP